MLSEPEPEPEPLPEPGSVVSVPEPEPGSVVSTTESAGMVPLYFTRVILSGKRS